jgi:UPF0716 family protein affecting phage T7 exclusion
MFKRTNILERFMAIIGGLCLIYPGLVTDIIGFSLIAVVTILQYLGYKRDQRESVVEGTGEGI